MAFKTKTTKIKEINREWHLVDAKEQILGRLAVKIASLLMGKEKTNFVHYLDGGDFVVVINAAKIELTGEKKKKNVYYRHSGYPGGFKTISFQQQMTKDPKKIIYHAVSGMLPQNKLRDRRLARLKIFIDDRHNYEDKFSREARMLDPKDRQKIKDE